MPILIAINEGHVQQVYSRHPDPITFLALFELVAGYRSKCIDQQGVQTTKGRAGTVQAHGSYGSLVRRQAGVPQLQPRVPSGGDGQAALRQPFHTAHCAAVGAHGLYNCARTGEVVPGQAQRTDIWYAMDS